MTVGRERDNVLEYPNRDFVVRTIHIVFNKLIM